MTTANKKNAVGAAVILAAVVGVIWFAAAGALLQGLVVFVAAAAAAAVVAGWAGRQRWLYPLLFWAALSLPLVKHFGGYGGLPTINADHLIVYPVDVILFIGLVWATVSAVTARDEGVRSTRAALRRLGAIFRPDLFGGAIVALGAAALVSVYHAPKPVLVFVGLIDIARFYATYILFRYLAADGGRPVALAFLVAAAAQAALCLVEFFSQNNFGLWEKPGWGGFVGGPKPKLAPLLLARAGGTFEPNITAHFLQIALPFAAVYFLAAKGGRRLFFLLLTALLWAAIFFTFSRGGWLGAEVAFAVVVISGWALRRRLRAPWPATLVLTLSAVVLLLPTACILLARGAGGDFLSAASRVTDWRTALAMIRDHPLLGVGKGNYVGLAQLYNRWALGFPVHNIYLLTWAETGILGLSALAALIYGAFRAPARLLKSDRATDVAFGVAAVAAFAGVAVRMFISMSFIHPLVILTFGALAAAAHRNFRR